MTLATEVTISRSTLDNALALIQLAHHPQTPHNQVTAIEVAIVTAIRAADKAAEEETESDA